MGVTITNKVFYKQKEKRERNKKGYAKDERNLYIKKEKCKSVHEFPSLVGLTSNMSNMHSSEGNNTTSFHW